MILSERERRRTGTTARKGAAADGAVRKDRAPIDRVLIDCQAIGRRLIVCDHGRTSAAARTRALHHRAYAGIDRPVNVGRIHCNREDAALEVLRHGYDADATTGGGATADGA